MHARYALLSEINKLKTFFFSPHFIDITLELLVVPIPISPGLFRALRMVRIARLLRSIKHLRGIRQLVFTAIKSAPALSNVCCALLLIVFIYAVMGMAMFGRVKFSKHLNEGVNFRTFGSSMALLFRISTAAGWNNVLDALEIGPPDCDPTKTFPGVTGNGVTEGDCGNKLVAVIYFVSYIMLMSWIIINVYVAVLIENFNTAQNQETIGITEDAIEDFYEVWKLFDPKATQFIHVDQLPEFMENLEKPFHLNKQQFKDFNSKGDIAIRKDEKCHCVDILKAQVKYILGGEKRCTENEDVNKVLEKVGAIFSARFPVRNQVVIIDTTLQRYQRNLNAVLMIQRLLRYHNYKNYVTRLLRNTRKMRGKYGDRYIIKELLENMIVPSIVDDDGGNMTHKKSGKKGSEQLIIRNLFVKR